MLNYLQINPELKKYHRLKDRIRFQFFIRLKPLNLKQPLPPQKCPLSPLTVLFGTDNKTSFIFFFLQQCLECGYVLLNPCYVLFNFFVYIAPSS